MPDWFKLARHDAVSVVQANGPVTSGKIDMIAVNRSVFGFFGTQDTAGS
ncbi:hypothetical protein ACIPYU_20355 [Paenarthrobacter nicotinovorans]